MKKIEQIKKCKSLLKNYKEGELIEGADKDFLLTIFENHYNWGFKKGNGVESITVHNETHFNKRFLLNRIDGTKMPISYKKSIQKTNVNSLIKEACRGCIRTEIDRFIKENIIWGISRCPITNKILQIDNTHIDHYDLTFSEMFNQWIVGKDLDFVFEQIENKTDSIYKTFIEGDLKKEFINFHNSKCKLRAVTKEINLEMGKLKLK